MDDCCSICTETFHDPKSLPCFHTFCQECLQMYINKYSDDKSFNCPLCRREIEPMDLEKPKGEWARLFHCNITNPKPQNPSPTDLDDSVKVNQTPKLPLKLITTVTLNGNLFAGINDMVMLIDQCFIISDACYKKVWKFSKSGEYLQNTPFDKEPFGLCLLQDNCVAVSIPHDKKIIILDCENLKTVKDTISFEKSYSSLGSDDKKRIFSLYRDEKMCVDVISKSSPQSSYAISHVIKLPFYFCGIYRLRVLPSGYVLIINSQKFWTLCCVDENGEVVFLYEGNEAYRLNSTSDVAVSTHFIYVVDKPTNAIHRIEHQGNFVDIPLTESDGISQPNKIYVNDEGVIAVIVRKNDKCHIQIFSS